MATIEPRLMHLLNNSATADPPPIHAFTFDGLSASHVSLPHAETDAGNQRLDQLLSKPMPPLHTLADENPARQPGREDGLYTAGNVGRRSKASRSLRVLLRDDDFNNPSHSLRMILDGTPEMVEDASGKKRHRNLTVKDDFVQLPQPLKKQKSTQQVVPPIINGLHEPPPNAAVFPPIASCSFDEAETPNVNVLKEFTNLVEDRTVANPGPETDNVSVEKNKRRAPKPRRKWSEEETNHLLLGVSRHGVGKWTTILEDSDFKFDNRTAGDLKDRFRTCCPAELRGYSGNKASRADRQGSEPASGLRCKAKKGLPLGEILIDDEALVERDKLSPPRDDAVSSPPKQRKSRAHRKRMEDLMELGIHGPFKKSHRRERRPFTEHDDREILEGLDKYGPAWTKIQRDPHFHLSSRQPTDLRDRVRNKYPKVYARIDKGSFQVKESGRGDILEPSVNTSIGNSLDLPVASSHPKHTNSKDSSMLKWPLSSGLAETTESIASAAVGLQEPSAAFFNTTSSEMDISRLLLDDPRCSPDHAKTAAPESLSNSTSSAGGSCEQLLFEPGRRSDHYGSRDRKMHF